MSFITIISQLAAGGADNCHHISFTAANTVISTTRPCGLQDSADALMDLAKALEDDDMMKFAQYFAFQARNDVCFFSLSCSAWF